jgi:hypothetical protein
VSDSLAGNWGERMTSVSGWSLGGLAILALVSAYRTSAWAQEKQTSRANPEPPTAPSSQSLGPSGSPGSEVCKTCHEAEYNSWEKSPHWKTTLNTKEGPSHQGCEACHGAAASHVADPSDTSKLFLFEKASSKEVNARCLTCHAGGNQHMNALNGFSRSECS